MTATTGIVMYSCGTKCITRAIVCLYSLRKFYDGPVTFFIEEPTTPKEFVDVCKYFKADVVKLPGDPTKGALVKKTQTLWNTPYDKTLWLDADTIVNGKIDEMFDYLDDECSFAIPNFSNWWSDGKGISRRIKRLEGLVPQEYLEESLKHYPAINTGVFSYKKQTKFLREWIDLTLKVQSSGKRIFIFDEICCQILMPQFKKEIKVVDPKFNVSVLYGNEIKDKRVIHFHGSKEIISGVALCEIWKSTFSEMCAPNIANINSFLKYADKRLAEYLRQKNDPNFVDVTIVTAIDEYYLPILAVTYPNWVRYKGVNKFPTIVFVNGVLLNDPKLDFLRLPNVQLVKWDETCMDPVETHRELMLSAFIFGTADHVKTDYWIKLDADSFATNEKPLYDMDFKNYAFVSHKWGYSRPEMIKKLDEWAKGHWKRKLRKSKPMIEDGRIDGNRFYHNKKRNISFIQFHKTKFIKFCVSLLRTRRLPVPSHDTFTYYVCQKFDPQLMSLRNFKRDYGFTQGKGKLGVEHIKQKLAEVEKANANKTMPNSESSDQTFSGE